MEGLTSQLTAAAATQKLKQNEGSMTKDIGSSSSAPASIPESLISDKNYGSNSDHPFHGDGSGGDDMIGDDDDGLSDYDDNVDEYDYIFDNEDDDYLSMQAQLDNFDLPPGVEASFSWLKDCTPTSAGAASSSVQSQLCSSSQPAGVGTSKNLLPESSVLNSSIGQGSTGNGKEENGGSDDVIRKYQCFKRFDTVDDFSDHHYNNAGFQGQQPPKAWSKKVQDEWKILENDLPDTIYVRVYETRMDLLRAVIVGPQGTPYHDGLFVFDVLFPPTYPDTPPMVYYYSGGLRLNPNLYNCGKVCLSLLNTWTGNGSEKWQPNQSTMLQVLVSIQALILNAKPFFNEPGYDTTYVGADGERKSKAYNENIFILSLKTMMYTLRRPPRNFEDLVIGHFQTHAHDILSACKAYREGAPIGSDVQRKPEGTEGNDVPENAGKRDFKAAVTKVTNALVSTFTKYGGVKDCEQFRLPG